MTSTSDDTAPDDNPPATRAVTPMVRAHPDPHGAPTDLFQATVDRHPSALVRHLDDYLAAVARELQTRGVLTGAPKRSDPAHRLFGSIVLDCSPLPRAAPASADQVAGTGSHSDAVHAGRNAPVVATWDQDTGWCVGLHHDPIRSSRRYLHPHLLPVPTAVAEFVVGLARGHPLGSAHPITATTADGPRLRLVATDPAPP